MQETLIDRQWGEIFRIENGAVVRNDPNYVGIVNLGKIFVYEDKKLFRKEGNSLLFDLYENSVLDLEEIPHLRSAIKIDAEKPIKVSKGMFDIFVPYLFIEEISKILKYGILKLYELKKENKKYLKGKLDLKTQFNNYLRKNKTIGSIYWDLTTDIYLNQILLFCCRILASDGRLTEKVRGRFASYANILSSEGISDLNFSYNDLIIKPYIPKRYLSAYTLARAIILRKYHQSSNIDEVECPSFMLDASVIWESFLRSALREGFKSKGWDIIKSKFAMTLYKPNLMAIPDIIAEKKNDKHIMVIDAKYKSGFRRVSDIYQVSIYLSALRERREFKSSIFSGFLMYLSWENELQKNYIFYPYGIEMNKEILNNIKIIYVEQFLNSSMKNGKLDFKPFSQKLCDYLVNLLK